MAELYEQLKPKSKYYDRSSYASQEEYDKKLLDTCTVYVGNLSFYTSQDSIYELFSRCGEVKDIKMGINDDGHPAGFCFVMYLIELALDSAPTNKQDLPSNTSRIQNCGSGLSGSIGIQDSKRDVKKVVAAEASRNEMSSEQRKMPIDRFAQADQRRNSTETRTLHEITETTNAEATIITIAAVAGTAITTIQGSTTIRETITTETGTTGTETANTHANASQS